MMNFAMQLEDLRSVACRQILEEDFRARANYVHQAEGDDEHHYAHTERGYLVHIGRTQKDARTELRPGGFSPCRVLTGCPIIAFK